MDDRLVALIAIISTILAVVFYSEQRKLSNELSEHGTQHTKELWAWASPPLAGQDFRCRRWRGKRERISAPLTDRPRSSN
jgi:hypothetical protein